MKPQMNTDEHRQRGSVFICGFIHTAKAGFLGLRAGKAILYPSGMMVEEVKLEAVDIEDERFRISEDLDPVRFEESLCQVGQLHPVQLLVGENSKFLVICGFRRLRALRKIGRLSAWARIWSAAETWLFTARIPKFALCFKTVESPCPRPNGYRPRRRISRRDWRRSSRERAGAPARSARCWIWWRTLRPSGNVVPSRSSTRKK